MTRDHDPMALLSAEPTGPAAAPLRDRIARAVAEYYRDQHGIRDIGAARDVAALAIRMVAETATANINLPAADISQVDAIRLLYARLTGEDSPLGRAAYAVLRFHYVLPGPGTPEPGCSFCAGAGECRVDDLGPQHCHCRCDCCACGDPLCLGPCDVLGVLLDELVLRGVHTAAVDVPRALLVLHAEAIRRLTTAAISERLGHDGGQYVIGVDQDAAQPGTLILHVNSGGNSLAAEPALNRHGYRCELLDSRPPSANAVAGVRIRVRPPD